MPVTIPFGKPFIIGSELEYIEQAVRLGNLSGNHEFTRRCQAHLEKTLGARKALLTHSCTGALEMAAILCDLQPGDEVIMPSFTFVSTANAFVLRGAKPVFVDIRPDTFNIDERLIEAALSPRTRAIAVVHYGGVACDMETILGLARRHGLRVVEDAAHCSALPGLEVPSRDADLACLSFHETKNVISGEGGALLVQAPELVARAEIIWEKGTNRSAFFRGEVDRYTWVDIGSSFLPSEVTAAFLYAQLEHAERITERRLALCAAYRERLAALEARAACALPAAGDGSGHVFYVLAADAEEREALLRHMKSRGILAVSHYVPLHSSPRGRELARTASAMAVTERIAATLVRLPLYFEMREDELQCVCDALYAFYR